MGKIEDFSKGQSSPFYFIRYSSNSFFPPFPFLLLELFCLESRCLLYYHTTQNKVDLVRIVEEHRTQFGNNTHVDWFNATKALNDFFNLKLDKETWRSRYRKNKELYSSHDMMIENTIQEEQWKNVLITCTQEEYGKLDEAMMIQKMGFHPSKWKIRNVIANKWWNDTSEDGQTLFHGQLKINIEPTLKTFDFEWYEEHLKNVKPNLVQTQYKHESDTLLYCQFNDMHFGVMNYNDYYETLQNTLRVIEQRHRDKILFIIGGDLIHNNDLKGHTANLTPIEQVDMNQAIEDSINFFTPLINQALSNSNEVSLAWNKGNHDEMVSMMITRELRAIYPQCDIELSNEEYKLVSYGNNAIGFTHGDAIGRSNKEFTLHNAYMELYPDHFTVKHNRYIFTEHYHRQSIVDEWGTHVYTLATRKKNDKWHKKKLFIGAKKQFTLFEFDKDSMIKEHRV